MSMPVMRAFQFIDKTIALSMGQHKWHLVQIFLILVNISYKNPQKRPHSKSKTSTITGCLFVFR